MHRLIAAILLATGILAAGGLPPAMAHPVRPVEQGGDAAPVAPPTVFPGEPSQLPAGSASPAAAPPAPVAVAGAFLALAALLALLVVLGVRRRVLALGLALVLGVLAFESAIHSIHHLGSSEESSCAVAAAAAHLQATVGEPVVEPAEPLYAGAASAVVEPVRRAAPSWRAWRGRAPPSIPIS